MSEVYLGNPPARIIEWCKRKYGKLEGTVCFTAKEANSTVGMICITEDDASPLTVSLQTSYDKKKWTDWTGEIITLANAGDKVYVKAGTQNEYFATIDFENETQIINQFVLTGNIAVSGNIMFLLDPTGTSTTLNGEYSDTSIKSAFHYIFGENEALTDASELILPATSLAACCYAAMFAGCTSLTTAPTLPATTLAIDCYCDMFAACTSLTAAPALPATTLAEECYSFMFDSCTSLTSAPALPATTLADECYMYMFQNCTSLSEAPTLPATTLADSCYADIFNDDENITDVNMPNITESEYDSELVGELAESHTVTIHFKEVVGDAVCFKDIAAGSTVNMTCLSVGSSGIEQIPLKASLQYSTDNKQSWQEWDGSTVNLDYAGGIEKVYIRALNPNTAFCKNILDTYDPTKENYIHIFTFTGKVEGSGNIQYLLDPTGQKTDVPEQAFAGLFTTMTIDVEEWKHSLTTAPTLPATTLANQCYRNMFDGCKGLTATPALPATTLADYCYECMFKECTSLSSAPTLPATTLASSCYNKMFNDDEDISEVNMPNITESEYNPDLAGTLATSHTISIKFKSVPKDDMFGFEAAQANSTVSMICYGVPSGTTPTVVPLINSLQYSTDNQTTWQNWDGSIVTLANVGDKVFIKATSTNAAFCCDIIDTIREGAYIHMFNLTGKVKGIGNIQYLLDSTGQRTDVPEQAFSGMFNTELLPETADASALISTPDLPATTLAKFCYRQMFNYCMGLKDASNLSATTLAQYCCTNMFTGCTSLTAAPALPATTMVDGCYGCMFNACTSLSAAPLLPATTLASNCYIYMFDGSSNVTDVNMPNVTQSEYTSASAGSLAQSHTITIHFKSEPSTENPVCFTATQAGSTVAMTCLEANSEGDMQNVPIKQSLQYSTDNQATWQAWDGSIITLANIGDKAFIKASVNNGAFCTYDIFDGPSEGDYVHIFQLTGKIEGSGNIQYLLDPTGQRTDVPEYAYESLFVDENSTGALTKAPDLSATTLAKGCYAGMFYGNTNLTKAPDLPATQLAKGCYIYMFYGCNIEDPVKIYATSYDDYSCDNVVDSDSVDPAYHFVQMSRNDVKAAIANNSTIFGDSYYFNAVCSDGETYLFIDEEQTQYQLTGTDVYYYGEYDEYAPSTTIVGTVTSTSEQLTDTGVLSVQFNGAEQLGGFNELVKFTIVSDDEITVSTGDASGFNENEIGDVNYYNINDKDIWIHLPIEVAE